MVSRSQSTANWAAVTALLYFLLAVVAARYYRKFKKIVEGNKRGGIHQSNVGKFDEAKAWFFFWLTICATADIPLYLGCVIMGGPHDCEWNTLSYALSWFLHLCAVCGYAYTIISPCLLWSDMLQKKDGILFFTKYPLDFTKRFFQFSLCAYLALTFSSIMIGIVYYKVSDSGSYTSNIFYTICIFLEPVVILLIAAGCLWSGIQLQLYVRRAKLGLLTEIRFLLHMNLTMAVITFTYLTRAIFILRLVTFMPDNYRQAFKCSYPVWLIVTRWLPYIFCSFCLIFMMRASGAEVAAKPKTRSKSIPSNESMGQSSSSRGFGSSRIFQVFSLMPVRHRTAESTAGQYGEEKHYGSEHSISILSGGIIDERTSLLSESLLSDQNPRIDSEDLPASRTYSDASSAVSEDPIYSPSHDGLHELAYPTPSSIYTTAAESHPSPWRLSFLSQSPPLVHTLPSSMTDSASSRSERE